MKFYSILLVVLLCFGLSYAQTEVRKPLKNYFVNPLDIPISLSGSYGECRPNHFHTGIDLRTNQQENLIVRAAAEGFVKRVVISHTGYGNTIYLEHPNGYMTVYAHLNDFEPKLMAYVKEQQYKQKRWNVDLTLPDSLFRYSKREQIAWSGNTGGSVAPHLHFEIREVKSGRVCNAALFGLPIIDDVAPIIKGVAIYDADKSLYQQTPIYLFPKKVGSSYELSPLNVPFKRIRIGVKADDMMQNSTNILGIYEMRLFKDGVGVLSLQQNSLDFADSRYMNAFGDYKTYKEKKAWYQGLYRLPNNGLDFYKGGDGILDLAEQQAAIRLELIDPFGNKSIVTMKLGYNGGENRVEDKCEFDVATTNLLATEYAKFHFSPEYFYDNVCLKMTRLSSNALSDRIAVGSSVIPLHDYSDLSLRLKGPIPFFLRTKLVLLHKVKAERLPGAHPRNAVVAKYKDGWAHAMVRTLGQYEVAVDTIAPKITPLFQSTTRVAIKKNIRFKVTEDLTHIQECAGYIDGKWVAFARKGNVFTYSFDEHCTSGSHELKVVVADASNNVRTAKFQFKN